MTFLAHLAKETVTSHLQGFNSLWHANVSSGIDLIHTSHWPKTGIQFLSSFFWGGLGVYLIVYICIYILCIDTPLVSRCPSIFGGCLSATNEVRKYAEVLPRVKDEGWGWWCRQVEVNHGEFGGGLRGQPTTMPRGESMGAQCLRDQFEDQFLIGWRTRLTVCYELWQGFWYVLIMVQWKLTRNSS